MGEDNSVDFEISAEMAEKLLDAKVTYEGCIIVDHLMKFFNETGDAYDDLYRSLRNVYGDFRNPRKNPVYYPAPPLSTANEEAGQIFSWRYIIQMERRFTPSQPDTNRFTGSGLLGLNCFRLKDALAHWLHEVSTRHRVLEYLKRSMKNPTITKLGIGRFQHHIPDVVLALLVYAVYNTIMEDWCLSNQTVDLTYRKGSVAAEQAKPTVDGDSDVSFLYPSSSLLSIMPIAGLSNPIELSSFGESGLVLLTLPAEDEIIIMEAALTILNLQKERGVSSSMISDAIAQHSDLISDKGMLSFFQTPLRTRSHARRFLTVLFESNGLQIPTTEYDWNIYLQMAVYMHLSCIIMGAARNKTILQRVVRWLGHPYTGSPGQETRSVTGPLNKALGWHILGVIFVVIGAQTVQNRSESTLARKERKKRRPDFRDATTPHDMPKQTRIIVDDTGASLQFSAPTDANSPAALKEGAHAMNIEGVSSSQEANTAQPNQEKDGGEEMADGSEQNVQTLHDPAVTRRGKAEEKKIRTPKQSQSQQPLLTHLKDWRQLPGQTTNVPVRFLAKSTKEALFGKRGSGSSGHGPAFIDPKDINYAPDFLDARLAIYKGAHATHMNDLTKT